MQRNLIMYVPFGALLALLGLWPGWSGVIRAFLLTGAISFGMESAQTFLSEREPSSTDLLLNAAGGAFGFLLVRTIETDPRLRRRLTRANRLRLQAHEQEG